MFIIKTTHNAGKQRALENLAKRKQDLHEIDLSCMTMGLTTTPTTVEECKDKKTFLKGLDLSFSTSTSKNKVSLKHADFSGTNLEDANFSHVDLEHANFSHANLEDANFSHANLEDANFSRANLEDVKFYGATLSKKPFKDIVDYYHRFTTTQKPFIGTNLKDINLCENAIQNKLIVSINLTGATVSSEKWFDNCLNVMSKTNELALLEIDDSSDSMNESFLTISKSSLIKQ